MSLQRQVWSISCDGKPYELNPIFQVETLGPETTNTLVSLITSISVADLWCAKAPP
jgi:hypothetical protein